MPRKRNIKQTSVQVHSLDDVRNLLVQLVAHKDDSKWDSDSYFRVNSDGEVLIRDGYDIRYQYESIDGAVKFLQNELDELNNPPETVRVGSYTAKISANGISVGCTEVSWEVYDRIAAAVERRRAK